MHLGKAEKLHFKSCMFHPHKVLEQYPAFTRYPETILQKQAQETGFEIKQMAGQTK